MGTTQQNGTTKDLHNKLDNRRQNPASEGNNSGAPKAGETKPKSSKELATIQKRNTMQSLMTTMQEQFKRALAGTALQPERFTRIAMTIYNDPKIMDCDATTFLSALMQSAQAGLEPNTPLGEAFLIPYTLHRGTPREKKVIQFQIGYKGILRLCYNTGEYQDVYAKEVYPRDQIDYEEGLHRKLVHIPYKGPKEGEPIAYYAVYHLKNGGYGFSFMYRADVLAHAMKYSKQWDKTLFNGRGGFKSGSSWADNFDGMAKKTVLSDALKYAPKSVTLERILSADGTVKAAVSEDMSEIIPEMDIEAEVLEDAVPVDKETGEILNAAAGDPAAGGKGGDPAKGGAGPDPAAGGAEAAGTGGLFPGGGQQ